MSTELKDFIYSSITQIRDGVNEFNKDSLIIKAWIPSTVSFEIYIDEHFKIGTGGKDKIVLEVSMSYHPENKE